MSGVEGWACRWPPHPVLRREAYEPGTLAGVKGFPHPTDREDGV